jgi:branched-chain amino acid transport system ATP-binding protein
MLELRNITAGYGQQIVLRNVSLVVPDNAVVSLLGPNGAGKTTLLRVAGGLVRPVAGQVLLDGVDVTNLPPHRRALRGLGHVREGRSIFASMSVTDNLRMQSRPEQDRAGTGSAIAAFPRLGQRLRQVAGSLSGGEQQMLALAAVYLARPSVCLLDELSLGLAPKVVDDIYEHLRTIAASGASLLLVEQYVVRALGIADYVYILKKGEVEFVGHPSELGEDDVLSAYLGASA